MLRYAKYVLRKLLKNVAEASTDYSQYRIDSDNQQLSFADDAS
jgi:hypothetical protein